MEESAKILVVDDDPRLCRLLARYLEKEGYAVRTASGGEEMRRLMEEEWPQLFILDVLLPREDGFSLARELRSRSDVGIVMLTGKGDVVDRVVGLEVGADDYITKPFDERELLARVRSVLRRISRSDANGSSTAGEQRSIARFSGWKFDLGAFELTSPQGEPVQLTRREFRLLTAFVEHPNHVLSRDAILDLVAGRGREPFDRSVDVLVGKLRKKIEQDPLDPRLIITVRGVGYKLGARADFD